VGSIGHRRMRIESASTLPEYAGLQKRSLKVGPKRPIEPDVIDVILKRFRFIDPRTLATAARDKLVSTSCPFAHGGTDHRQSYSTRLHCTYQLAWRQGITSM
jgi:hypothetical protein